MGSVVIEDMIRTVLAEVAYDLDPGTLQHSDSFKDLGVDSMDRVEVVSLMLNKLGIDVPVREIGNTDSIRELFRSDGLLAASCEMSTQQSLEK